MQMADPGTPSLEALQREGREAWLAMRAESQAKERSPEPSAKKATEKTLEPVQDRTLTVDEEREQGAKRWLEYRRTHSLAQSRSLGPNPGPEKGLEQGREQGLEKGPEQARGLRKGLDGPEIE
jgi:hypothetical protein